MNEFSCINNIDVDDNLKFVNSKDNNEASSTSDLLNNSPILTFNDNTNNSTSRHLVNNSIVSTDLKNTNTVSTSSTTTTTTNSRRATTTNNISNTSNNSTSNTSDQKSFYSTEIECYKINNTGFEDLNSSRTNILDLGIDQLNNCFDVSNNSFSGGLGPCGGESSTTTTTADTNKYNNTAGIENISYSTGSTVLDSTSVSTSLSSSSSSDNTNTTTNNINRQQHSGNNIIQQQHHRIQRPQSPVLSQPALHINHQQQQNNIRLPQHILFQENRGGYITNNNNFQPIRYSNQQQYGLGSSNSNSSQIKGHASRQPNYQYEILGHNQHQLHTPHHPQLPIQYLQHQHQTLPNQHNIKQIQNQPRTVVNNTQLQYINHPPHHHHHQQQQHQQQQHRYYNNQPNLQHYNIQQYRPQLVLPNQQYINRHPRQPQHNIIPAQVSHSQKNQQIVRSQQNYLEDINNIQGYNNIRSDAELLNNFGARNNNAHQHQHQLEQQVQRQQHHQQQNNQLQQQQQQQQQQQLQQSQVEYQRQAQQTAQIQVDQQQYINNISESKKTKPVESSPTAVGLLVGKESEFIISDINDQIVLTQQRGGQFLIPSSSTNIRGEPILNSNSCDNNSILNHEISLSEYIQQKQTNQEDFIITTLENQELQSLIQFGLNPPSVIISSSSTDSATTSSAIIQQNSTVLNNSGTHNIQQIGIIPTNNSTSIIPSAAVLSSPVQLSPLNHHTHNRQQHCHHQLQQQQQQLTKINNRPITNLTTSIDCEKSPIQIKVLTSPSSTKFTKTTTTTIVKESLREREEIIPPKYQFSLKSLDENKDDNNISICEEIDKEKLILHKKELDIKQNELKKKLLIQEQRLHRQKQIELEKENQLLLEKQSEQINSKTYVDCGGYSSIQSYYDNVDEILMNNSPNNSCIDTSAVNSNVVVSKSDDHSVTLKILKNTSQMNNSTDISGKFKIPPTSNNSTNNSTIQSNTPQLLKKARVRPRKKQPEIPYDSPSTSSAGCAVTTPAKSVTRSPSAKNNIKIKPIKTSTPKNISKSRHSNIVDLQESNTNNLSSKDDSGFYNNITSTSSSSSNDNNMKLVVENSSMIANECTVMTTPMPNSSNLKNISTTVEESIAAVASITSDCATPNQFDVDYLQQHQHDSIHQKQQQHNMPLLNLDNSSTVPSTTLQLQVVQVHHQPPAAMVILPSPSREIIVGEGGEEEDEEEEEDVVVNREETTSATHTVVEGSGDRIIISKKLTSPISPTKNIHTTPYPKDENKIHSSDSKDRRRKRRRKIFDEDVCTDERNTTEAAGENSIVEEVDAGFNDSISITSNSVSSICSRSTYKSKSQILSKTISLLNNRSSKNGKKYNNSHHHHRRSHNKHKSRSKRKSNEKSIDIQHVDDSNEEEEEEDKYDQANDDCCSSSSLRRRRRHHHHNNHHRQHHSRSSVKNFSTGGKKIRKMTIDEDEDHHDDNDNVSSITSISVNNSRVDSRIIINRSDDEFTNNDQDSVIISNRGGEDGGDIIGVDGDSESVVMDEARVVDDGRNSPDNNNIFRDRPELKEIVSLTKFYFNFDRKKYFDIDNRTQGTWLHRIFVQDSEETTGEQEQIFSLYDFLFSKEDYSFKQIPKSLVQFLEAGENNIKECEIKNKIRLSVANTVYNLFVYIKDHASIMSVASVEEELLMYIRKEFVSTLNSNFKNTFSGKTSVLEPYLKHIVQRGYRKSFKPKKSYDVVAWASCSTIDGAVKHISFVISKVMSDFENIVKSKQGGKTPIIYQQYIDYILDLLNKEMSSLTKNIRSLLIQLAHCSELFTFLLFGINKPNEDMLHRNNINKSMDWPCGMFLNLAISISKVLVIQDKLKDQTSSIPIDNDDRREFMENIYSKNVLFCLPLMVSLGLSPDTNNVYENDSKVVCNGAYSSFFDFCNQDLNINNMSFEGSSSNKPSTSSNKINKYSNYTTSSRPTDYNKRSMALSSSSKYVQNERKRKFNDRRYGNNNGRVESDYDDTDDGIDHDDNLHDSDDNDDDDDDGGGNNTAIEIIDDEEDNATTNNSTRKHSRSNQSVCIDNEKRKQIKKRRS